jgi:hypothetical protein
MAVTFHAAASGMRGRLILAVLYVALLMITVDDATLKVALPSIVRGLRASTRPTTHLHCQTRIAIEQEPI